MLNEACPYCRSDKIEADEGFSYDGGFIVDSQKCNACGKKFWGVYRFCQFEDENGKVIVG